MQSCITSKPLSDNIQETNSNGVETVIVRNPQIKDRASIFSWIISIGLVPCFGVGLIPMIFCASSGSINKVESEEAALKWANLYGRKNKNQFIVIPSNKNKNVEREHNWVWIKDYSEMKLITPDAEMKFYANTPEDVVSFKALFPNSNYTDSFVKRTAISADESTLLSLIYQYPTSTEINLAKKRYILFAKYYKEFNIRLDIYNVNSTVFSKDEKAKKASTLITYFEDVSDYVYRYGSNTIYDDQVFSKALAYNPMTEIQLETLISWFPNSKHKELAISLLVEKTQDINLLNKYLTLFSGSSNISKLKEKIIIVNNENQRKKLAAEKAMAEFKKSGDYRKNYETIKVGKYELMATNLDVTHYRNGEPIRKAQSVDEWEKITQDERCSSISKNHVYPVYCDNPKDADNGKLYNWAAFADERNIAPEGWRDPTNEEWDEICEIIKNNKYLWRCFNNSKSGYRNISGLYENDLSGLYELDSTLNNTFLWVFSKMFLRHKQSLNICTSTSNKTFDYHFFVNGESCGNGLSIRLIRDR